MNLRNISFWDKLLVLGSFLIIVGAIITISIPDHSKHYDLSVECWNVKGLFFHRNNVKITVYGDWMIVEGYNSRGMLIVDKITAGKDFKLGHCTVEKAK